MCIDFVSDVVVIDNFDLKRRSRQNKFVLKINSFREIIFAILLAKTTNSGVCTVNFSPLMYVPLAFVNSR